MGQVQNLSSNPEKLSGICGQLRCCLRYEYQQYMENQQRDVVKEEKLSPSFSSVSHDVSG
jgi:cell fate regulator YaaT (PSP1 superfamily)